MTNTLNSNTTDSVFLILIPTSSRYLILLFDFSRKSEQNTSKIGYSYLR
jgi:hypothetical protein